MTPLRRTTTASLLLWLVLAVAQAVILCVAVLVETPAMGTGRESKRTWYWTKTGECYRSDGHCKGLRNARVVLQGPARDIPLGLRPCALCRPESPVSDLGADGKAPREVQVAGSECADAEKPGESNNSASTGSVPAVQVANSTVIINVYQNADPPGGESEDAGFQIFVRTLKRRSLPVTVGGVDLVYAIMVKVQEKEGIPVEQQRLVFKGKQLDPWSTVEESGIAKGDTVNLAGTLQGGGKAVVQGDDRGRCGAEVLTTLPLPPEA